MIFIISIILMFCLALSAVSGGFSTNAYKVSDKDFMARAVQNAQLEAMQLGDVYLRSGVLDTDDTTPVSNDTTMRNLFTYSVTPKSVISVTITSEITANKDSAGVETITAKAYK